jgi:predicted XRE-type DNA-binding protein
MRFPNKEQIEDILNSVSDDDFVEILPEEATGVEKVKYQLCKKFVTYMQSEKISQAELARRIDVDRSRINWIVKYKIEHFTIDRLYELLGKLDPSIELKVS